MNSVSPETPFVLHLYASAMLNRAASRAVIRLGQVCLRGVLN